MILLGGMTVFLGPLVGAVTLLLLTDVISSTPALRDYNMLVLGLIILVFALGLRKGILGSTYEWWTDRRRSDSSANPEAHAGGSHH